MEIIQITSAIVIMVITGGLVIYSSIDPHVSVDGAWWGIAATASTYLFTIAGRRRRKSNG